jgi:serine/threonine protein phosphatase 1
MPRDPASSGSRVSYPAAPEGYTIYLVGDIHGRSELLTQVQARIDRDMDAHRVGRSAEVYLGDYIDRGPDSAGVIDRLIARAKRVNTVFLRGNHEQLLLDFLNGADCLDFWRAVGGTTTLMSYGVDPAVVTRSAPDDVRAGLIDKLPPDHHSFFEKTGSYTILGSYLAVHAGIRPLVPLERQQPADLMGIRHLFLDHEADFEFIVIHGHTPVQEPEFRRNRINIDTGAFATGRLTCLRLGSDGARLLGDGPEET